MSVYLEEDLIANGLGPDDLIKDMPGYGVVAITAEVVRKKDLGVTRAPRPDQGPIGSAHAHVHGKKTGSCQKAMKEAAEKVVWPW